MNESILEVLKKSKRLLDRGKKERSDFFNLLTKSGSFRLNVSTFVTPWSHWYSLSYLEFLALFSEAGGLSYLLSQALDENSKIEAQSKFLTEVEDAQISTCELAKELGGDTANKVMMQLCIALDFNRQAIARRNRSINDMLQQIRDKVDRYEEVIFEAISIDKSVVTNFEISNHIARWTLEGNSQLLKKLSKAIAGKYPRNNRVAGLDDHRFMTSVLEDVIGKPTPKTVNEMNQILKTMAEGEDPIRSIRNHLDIRKEDTRKTKRKSSS